MSIRSDRWDLGPRGRELSAEEVWQRLGQWESGRDEQSRTLLIEGHLYLVRISMERLFPSLPTWVIPADLYQAGAMGLVRAVDEWDPTRGVQFRTWLIERIRWDLLEHVRQADRLTREQRSRLKRLERAEESVLSRGEKPTLETLLRETGWTEDKLISARGLRGLGPPLSLEEVRAALEGGDSEEAFSLGDALGDDGPDLMARAMARDLTRRVRRAMDSLPQRSRDVLRRHYALGEPLNAIARSFGLPGRCGCELHHAALGLLRRALARGPASPLSEPLGPEMTPNDRHLLFDDDRNRAKLFDSDGHLLWACPMQNSTVNQGSFGHNGNCPRGEFRLGDSIDLHSPAFGYHFTPVEDYGEHREMARWGRSGIGIHGGGTGLPDPFADRQGWMRTHGCLRVQNRDNARLVSENRSVRHAGGVIYLTVMGRPE